MSRDGVCLVKAERGMVWMLRGDPYVWVRVKKVEYRWGLIRFAFVDDPCWVDDTIENFVGLFTPALVVVDE